MFNYFFVFKEKMAKTESYKFKKKMNLNINEIIMNYYEIYFNLTIKIGASKN